MQITKSTAVEAVVGNLTGCAATHCYSGGAKRQREDNARAGMSLVRRGCGHWGWAEQGTASLTMVLATGNDNGKQWLTAKTGGRRWWEATGMTTQECGRKPER